MSNQWTAQDDATVVWLLLCCPFSEFQRLLPTLQNKKVSSIGERFLEIINSEELLQRVCMTTHNDIIAYKAAPWTLLEQLSLVRLIHNNKKCNQVQFLSKFPMLFHPSRTASSLNAANVRLNSKDQASLEYQLNSFREYCKNIHNEVADMELLPFPGPPDYKEQIQNYIQNENFKPDEPQIQRDQNIESIRQRAKERMTKKTFAVLVGPGNIRIIDKCKVVFGRRSPKCTPDIDLSDLCLQSISRLHCSISLATDLRFYLEVLNNYVLVNGIQFGKGKFILLNDRDLIDIGGACFIFLENDDLMNQLRGAL
ncbi:FHA domain containing protein [Histomonas meleagridis]|uniref:FHA domain containing protein n=1 Tax=Histomonas meleagridis TaxID=135588 RepID=UPI003559F4A2|nr:FHA domain containing protein [Histomonas meleagridis]KAH0797707.1 FHA domain containing protein [Histomonas meleagridis]